MLAVIIGPLFSATIQITVFLDVSIPQTRKGKFLMKNIRADTP